MTVCITPRWGGGPDDDWYPWLSRGLRPHQVIVSRLKPNPGAPEIDACVEELHQSLDTRPEALAQTVMIGHSVGCQATLRFLASLPRDWRVSGVLCVAGWWTVDDPWESIRPWIETPLALERIRSVAPVMGVLLSDDDPYTSDVEANRRAWRERLGAQVEIITGAGHFNHVHEPAVLAAAKKLL